MRKLVAVCCALPVVALAVPAVADVALAPQLLTPDTAQELYFGSVSGDGTRAYFWTSESLVSADGDASGDIYERNVATGGLRLITDRVQAGPDEAIDSSFSAAPSADGSRVLFATAEQIVDADDDTAQDVYAVTAEGTTLLTDRVKAGPDENLDASSAGMTSDGASVRILTSEALLDADGSSSSDVYLLRNGQLTLISDRIQAGPDEEKGAGGGFRTSADGSRILITTQEALLADDTDSASDLYLYDVTTGSTTLVSDGPQAGPDSADSLDSTYAIAPNGSRVFFGTKEALLPEDTDGTTWTDVFEYRVSDGVTTMVSDRVLPGPDGPNNAAITFSGGRPVSEDGTHVLFATSENLVAEDTDSEAGSYFDTYERVDGTTTKLVSDRVQAGPDENQNAFAHGISRDGSRIIFVTFEPILAEDKDSAQDVYLRQGGTTTMLSDRVPAGTTVGGNVSTAYANPDMTRVFFSTTDPLLAEDGDASSDYYERTVDAGVTTLLTDRAKAGPDESQPLQAVVHSEDSSRVFFSIDEQLVDADGDAFRDVYLANSPPLPDPRPDPTVEPTAEPTVVPTPVPTATPGATVQPKPIVTPPPVLKAADVVTLPSARRCVSRRKFRIKLRRPSGTTVTEATVFINGKKKKTFKGRAIRPTVDLRGLPKGRITVKIVIETADGRTARQTRKYRTCAPRRR